MHSQEPNQASEESRSKEVPRKEAEGGEGATATVEK